MVICRARLPFTTKSKMDPSEDPLLPRDPEAGEADPEVGTAESGSSSSAGGMMRATHRRIRDELQNAFR